MRTLLATLLLLGSAPAFAAEGTTTDKAAATAEADPTKRATAAAREWLAMVDKGEYAASWEASATPMKAAVTVQQWETAMGGVRAPLGTVTQRKVKSARYTKTLPGAPDGEYVVIQFRTSFAKKRAAVETVTPMLDADGTWRVSGYFIK